MKLLMLMRGASGGDRILLAHFVSILRVTPTSISKQVIKSKKNYRSRYCMIYCDDRFDNSQ